MRRLPVWSVALDGRVIWRPVRMLSGAEALAIMRRTAPPVPSLSPVVFSQPAMPMPVLPATPKPIPATAMPMPATRKPIPPLAKPIPAAPASGFFFLLAALVAALKGLFNGK